MIKFNDHLKFWLADALHAAAKGNLLDKLAAKLCGLLNTWAHKLNPAKYILLPGAVRQYARTFSNDLVSAKPMPEPKAELLYLDVEGEEAYVKPKFVYSDGRIEVCDKQIGEMADKMKYSEAMERLQARLQEIADKNRPAFEGPTNL